MYVTKKNQVCYKHILCLQNNYQIVYTYILYVCFYNIQRNNTDTMTPQPQMKWTKNLDRQGNLKKKWGNFDEEAT